MPNYLIGMVFSTIGLLIIILNNKWIEWNRRYYRKLGIKVKERSFFFYFHKVIAYLGGLSAIFFGIINLIK